MEIRDLSLDKPPVSMYYNNQFYRLYDKDDEKEEYAFAADRESGSSAGRPLKLRFAEGSF